MMTDVSTIAPAGYEQAIAAFRAGNIDEAKGALENCLAEVPDHVGTRFGLGVCYAKAGDSANAESMLRSVIKLDPTHLLARIELGRLFAKQGRTSDAIEEYGAVLAADPNNKDARIELARLVAPVPEQPTAVDPRKPESSSLADDLDDPEKKAAPSVAGSVIIEGHRRLLSHRRLWIGALLLLSAPLMKQMQNSVAALPGPAGQAADGFKVLSFILFVTAGLLIAAAVLSSMLTRYVVRERRVEIEKGVLFRSQRSVWLYDVTDIQFAQTPLLMLAGSGKLVLLVDEPNPSSKTAPALVGFGSARFLRVLQERLQPMVLRERRTMKKSFI